MRQTRLSDFERIAQLSFAQIKEKLYKREFSYKEIKQKKTYWLEDIDVHLADEASFAVKRSYTLSIAKDKEVKEDLLYSKVEVHLELSPHPSGHDKPEKFTFICFATKEI